MCAAANRTVQWNRWRCNGKSLSPLAALLFRNSPLWQPLLSHCHTFQNIMRAAQHYWTSCLILHNWQHTNVTLLFCFTYALHFKECDFKRNNLCCVYFKILIWKKKKKTFAAHYHHCLIWATGAVGDKGLAQGYCTLITVMRNGAKAAFSFRTHIYPAGLGIKTMTSLKLTSLNTAEKISCL